MRTELCASCELNVGREKWAKLWAATLLYDLLRERLHRQGASMCSPSSTLPPKCEEEIARRLNAERVS